MPPGPAFNWFCVAHSIVDILSHAGQIKAGQVASRTAPLVSRAQQHPRKRRRVEEESVGEKLPQQLPDSGKYAVEGEVFVVRQHAPLLVRHAHPSSVSTVDRDVTEINKVLSESQTAHDTARPSVPDVSHISSDHPTPSPTVTVFTKPHVGSEKVPVEPDRTPPTETHAEPTTFDDKVDLGFALTSDGPLQSTPASDLQSPDVSAVTGMPELAVEPAFIEATPIRKLQSSKVPSSRLGRLFHYGGLAASLGVGAASELIRRTTSSSDSTGSLVMTEGNIKRLVSKLSQMRGAALKLGQFMSIQDSHVLPPEIEDIFRRVQDSAHYMPDWQMEQVMQAALGPSWMSHFPSFGRIPFAAASIGQVHSAMLAASSSPTGKDEPVAVKIQFPNIKDSIESDLGYVKLLLTASKLLPRGLFLDRTIEVMKAELADECNYTREASFLRKFKENLSDDPGFKVPWVWEGSTDTVLVMERVDGVSVGGSVIDSLSQRDKNDIASRIIDLCLKELFMFRAMQTDPNWTNFLWNRRTRQIELVDFGATREYSKEFMDNWLHLLQAAASGDHSACVEWSLKLGYLTGQENEIMTNAHVRSMTLLATPFKESTPQPFIFGPGSAWSHITAEIRAQIPVMLQHRLTPPPRETYSLNRKLSGAFLLASRLNAQVDTRRLWENVVSKYRFG
ncbi:ABC1-domain-containing protein [Panus rudis PR-1116 ss-1]|nr:ABC1-domain-containing protein [Panus rudis PR-1116 ss-1]